MRRVCSQCDAMLLDSGPTCGEPECLAYESAAKRHALIDVFDALIVALEAAGLPEAASSVMELRDVMLDVLGMGPVE